MLLRHLQLPREAGLLMTQPNKHLAILTSLIAMWVKVGVKQTKEISKCYWKMKNVTEAPWHEKASRDTCFSQGQHNPEVTEADVNIPTHLPPPILKLKRATSTAQKNAGTTETPQVPWPVLSTQAEVVAGRPRAV